MADRVTLRINGREERLVVEGVESLAEALRRDHRLHGVREVCGIGVCGSCTVLADGAAISSCLVLAGLAEGLDIRTVEGLGEAGELDPVQQAFVDHAAFQCSFCTPGFIMATHALLAEEPHPTAERVREALAGNLCRCGSYQKILEAVLDAAERVAAGGSGGRAADGAAPQPQ